MVWYGLMAPPAPRATNQLDAKGDDLPRLAFGDDLRRLLEMGSPLRPGDIISLPRQQASLATIDMRSRQVLLRGKARTSLR